MANLLDFAEAYRRRKLAAEKPLIPMRQSPVFATDLPKFPTPTPPPMTSTGRGTSFTSGTTPPAAPRRNIRAALGAALTGAATAAATPVSATPGQEFRQALVRGLMGTSAAFNQERARQDTAEARAQNLAARLAELGMKPKPRTMEEEVELTRRKAEATLPTKLQLLREQSAAISGRMEKMKTADISRAKSLEEARLYAMAWDDVIGRENMRRQAAASNLEPYTAPDEATLSAAARAQYERIRTQGRAKEFDYLKPPTQ